MLPSVENSSTLPGSYLAHISRWWNSNRIGELQSTDCELWWISFDPAQLISCIEKLLLVDITILYWNKLLENASCRRYITHVELLYHVEGVVYSGYVYPYACVSCMCTHHPPNTNFRLNGQPGSGDQVHEHRFGTIVVQGCHMAVHVAFCCHLLAFLNILPVNNRDGHP